MHACVRVCVRARWQASVCVCMTCVDSCGHVCVQNKNRLDIAKLREDDEDITGGYIIEYKHGDNAKNEPEINCTM